MSTIFFGGSWGAPILDDARQVPAPVGEQCLHCGDSVVDGDCGFIRGVSRLQPDGSLTATAEPIHAECELISVLGHDLGVCHCTGYDTSTRAAARLAWERSVTSDGLTHIGRVSLEGRDPPRIP